MPRKKTTSIAILSEDTGHLTGGRYYVYFLASALVELGFKVTLYTNQTAVFASYFKDYKKPKIEVINGIAQDLQNLDVKADIYIGSPINGAIGANRLGAKYNKPAYVIIYDPIPMIEKYRGIKVNSQAWKLLHSEVSKSQSKVIALCEEPAKWAKTWLNRTDNQMVIINPCVNSKERDKVRKPKNPENYALWVSRIVTHKRLDHALYACRQANIKLKIIASVDGLGAKRLIKQQAMKDKAELIMKPSDAEKFKLMKGARILINSSLFEGFGIPTAEALSCGVPVVAYEYPTTREIEKQVPELDNPIYWAKFKDYRQLALQTKKAWREGKKLKPTKAFDFESLIERCREVFING